MDISHTCMHCLKGKKVYRISLDLYDDEGLLKRGVTRRKEFEFICTYCERKSFFDFYRFSHPDVILLLKRLDEQQTKLQEAIEQLVITLGTQIDKMVDFKIEKLI